MIDKKRKVLVIIPAYNEAENIVQVVNHMMETAPSMIIWWSMTAPRTRP